MWIDNNRVCQNYSTVTPPAVLPVMKCAPLEVRSILILECNFNVGIANIAQLTTSNLTVSDMTIVEVVVIDDYTFRAVTSQSSNSYKG